MYIYILVSPAWGGEDEEQALAELISLHSLEGDVEEVAPEHGDRNPLDERHGGDAHARHDRLQQVGQPLLVDRHRQQQVHVLLRVEHVGVNGLIHAVRVALDGQLEVAELRQILQLHVGLVMEGGKVNGAATTTPGLSQKSTASLLP